MDNLNDKNEITKEINELKDELAAFTKSREDITDLKDERLKQVSAFFKFGSITNVFTLVFASRLDAFVFVQFCLGILYILPKVCINISYKGYMFSIDNTIKNINDEIVSLEKTLSSLDNVLEKNKTIDSNMINKKKFSFNHNHNNKYKHYEDYSNNKANIKKLKK